MVKKLWIAFLLILALTLAAEPFVDWHAHFSVENIFAFNAAYGFLACAALILVAKAIGLLVKREEDYYGREDRENE